MSSFMVRVYCITWALWGFGCGSKADETATQAASTAGERASMPTAGASAVAGNPGDTTPGGRASAPAAGTPAAGGQNATTGGTEPVSAGQKTNPPTPGGAPATGGLPRASGTDDGIDPTTDGGAASAGAESMAAGHTGSVGGGQNPAGDTPATGGQTMDTAQSTADGCGAQPDGTMVPNGTVLDETNWSDCTYLSSCAENGHRTRSITVCEAGRAVERLEERPFFNCDRPTDNLTIDVGPYGACAYLSDCAQTGTKTRTKRVCFGGVEIEKLDTVEFPDCARETEGTVLRAGEYDGRCAYAGHCVETGTQARVNRVCQNGMEVDSTERTAMAECDRVTSDIVVVTGVYDGQCTYADECALTGTQTRQNTVCQNGQAIQQAETNTIDACNRPTDDKLLSNGPYDGQCVYGDECALTGTQTRQNTVCQNGQAIQQAETNTIDTCKRPTDDKLLSNGPYDGQCVYGDECALTGTQTRQNTVCQNGQAIQQAETNTIDACNRPTDDKLLSNGPYDGQCVFPDECALTGTQTRQNTVCQNGQTVQQPETNTIDACNRETEGKILVTGPYAAECDYPDACTQSGTRSRILKVCEAGRATNITEATAFAACDRVTEGLTVENGKYDGQCVYADDCAITGTQTRENRVCQAGESTRELETNTIDACNRQTDDRVVRNGAYDGQCVYADVCAETGTQTRENTVCRNGETTTQPETNTVDGCRRTTNTDPCLNGEGVCLDGQCSCPPDRPDPCENRCVDLQEDPLNCGECDNECRFDQWCHDGLCGRPQGGDAIDDFVFVPAGTFTMGAPETELGWNESNGPETEVTLTRGFWMQRFEVTQTQYETMVGDNPSFAQDCPQCPVEQVGYVDAAAYCNALSLDEGYTPCYTIENDAVAVSDVVESLVACEGYRLPTEAEWERAARAGTRTATYAGDLTSVDCSDDPALSPIAWYCANSNGSPQPVGQLAPNAYGLYDMLGNVAEFSGPYSDTLTGEPVTDPMGPAIGQTRPLRGGAFLYPAADSRATSRRAAPLDVRQSLVGFRAVRTAPLCEGAANGEVAEVEAFGVCEGFADVCDQTGQQTRNIVICDDGKPVSDIETTVCHRQTDGVECQGTGACIDGGCVCPDTARNVCAELCVDLLTDRHNCGGCGRQCHQDEVCNFGGCIVDTCGNGIQGLNEACDDNNLFDGDGCDRNCTLPGCGNSIINVGEECDDGNRVNHDECTNMCTIAECGDLIVGPGEACDDGNRVDTDDCTSQCQLARCGDGIVHTDQEQCDTSGETLDCDADCTLPVCGDGVVNAAAGEVCDDNNQATDDACIGCAAAFCGDGFTQVGVEACDDQNANNDDACTNQCTRTPEIQFAINLPDESDQRAGDSPEYSVTVQDINNPAGTQFTYQWFFDNTPVQGETSRSFNPGTLYFSDRGRSIHVRVSAINQGREVTKESTRMTLNLSRGELDCNSWENGGGKHESQRVGGPKPNLGTWYERRFGSSDQTCYIYYQFEFEAYPRFDSADAGVDAEFVLDVVGNGQIRYSQSRTINFGGQNQNSTINFSSDWRDAWQPEWGQPEWRLHSTVSSAGDVGFATTQESVLIEYGVGVYRFETRP
ncbi:MAG: SUMF1/EgtB/PvdO family nonheme iron enzyme [Myxococcota bacterium]|nr:SUMF1/EgtB/PvdO family nonheme iron enzyme [Myxococcota bacterium]